MFEMTAKMPVEMAGWDPVVRVRVVSFLAEARDERLAGAARAARHLPRGRAWATDVAARLADGRLGGNR
jgi:hypothetical protein